MVGRPKRYFNEEDRKQAIQQCMYVCIVCGNHDYKLAGRWRHIKTKKHKKTRN